jgi:hypothetical protein
MAYGNLLTDVVQSSTTNTPPVFKDGNGTETGTLCRAWVNFTGSNGNRNGSFNVSSVTRTGSGDYTINFATAMPDAYYAVTSEWSSAYMIPDAGAAAGRVKYCRSQSTSSFRMVCGYMYSGGTGGEDAIIMTVAVFR